MAVEVASLKAVLDLDKRGLDTGLKSASQGLNSFGSSIGGAMAALGAVGAAVGAFSVVTSAVGDMIGAAREAIAVNKDLEQTILATGGAAGVTVAMAKEYADSLSLVTNFQDDAILAGENLLLTFTKIGSDVFPKATETMLDVSQKMGQDLKSSAIQLGKALNDPVKGMGALTRIGVSFSALQKQQVKDFMAVNDIASAQGVILDAIATQGFGGMAKAMADPFIQVQNAIGEIQEMLGMGIMPMLLEIAKAVLPALQSAATMVGPALGQMGIALGKLEGEHLVGVVGLFKDLIGSVSTFLAGLNDLGASMGITAEGSSLLVTMGLLPLKIAFGTIGAVLSVLGVAFTILGNIIKVIAFAWVNMARAIETATGISAAVLPVWNALSAAGTTLSQIIQIIGMAWANLIRVLSQPFDPPKLITPGSATPLEMGLRGINSAIRAMPTLPSFGASGGMTPIASAGGGGASTITNIHLGGQSFSFTGDDGRDRALTAMLTMLRQQLNR